MIKKTKSFIIISVITVQKILDILHQKVMGLPSLKRSQISANLYLGGQYNLIGLHKLKEMGVTAIVSMREKSIYNEVQYEGFKFLQLPTIDNTAPTLENLLKGAEFIDAEIKLNGKVYIHCRQGIGRGPSMAIAYLLKIGTTFDDAYSLVKRVRPFINPTLQQIERLKELELYFKIPIV